MGSLTEVMDRIAGSEPATAVTTQAAPPTAEPTDKEVQHPAGEPPVQDKPASDAAPVETEVETEPDLESVPETSGDFAKYKEAKVLVDGKEESLFKAFPELRNIIGREQLLGEISPNGSVQELREIVQRIPSVADAEQLVSDAEAKLAFARTYREDPSQFVESLKESDPLAFQQFIEKLPEVLSGTDDRMDRQLAQTYSDRVLYNVAASAQQAGRQDIVDAVSLIAQALGTRLAPTQAQPATRGNSELEKLRREKQEREQIDQQAQFDNFWNQTDEAVIQFAVSEIESGLKKALPSATPAQIDRMKKETYQATLDMLNQQPQTISQIERYRADAQKGRRGIAEHKSIVSFITGRAKTVIPKALKSVVDEWSKQVLKLNQEKTEKQRAIADKTKDVGSGPQGTTSAAQNGRPNNGERRSFDSIVNKITTGTYQRPS